MPDTAHCSDQERQLLKFNYTLSLGKEMKSQHLIDRLRLNKQKSEIFVQIEKIIKKYSNGKIIIIDKEEKEMEPDEEMVKDVLQIMNVFVAKMNGRRKYNKK